MSIKIFKDLFLPTKSGTPGSLHDIYRPPRWDNDKYRVPEVYNACTAFVDGTLKFVQNSF